MELPQTTCEANCGATCRGVVTLDVQLEIHSAVLRKRNFAILGEWLPGVRYLEVERRSAQRFCPLSGLAHEDFVRCPESGSVRFSEVANVLQLWYFQL